MTVVHSSKTQSPRVSFGQWLRGAYFLSTGLNG
jgi:hypothetical protein